jgi:F-type H+-transporting ATPase subunit epsilon
MYERSFQLEIVTPERVVFQSEALGVSAPGTLGNFQVLHNHAPLLSTLEIGALQVKVPQGKDSVYAVSGGFLEVKNNTVVVLVETAEEADQIDTNRAKAAEERAVKRLQEKYETVDHERAKLALLRATNRLRIASHR